MTTVARKKGTQTFEATHLWNSLKIRVLIWGLQWMNYHFSLNWSRGIRTCNPTSTRSTPRRGRGRRSWSCAWSLWSSISASFSEGTAPRCLKYVGAVRWFPRTPSREFVIVWSKIHHCAFHHSPNLYSFCRRAACPWQRRWRWWYRGRMWGFPEHQWFSP